MSLTNKERISKAQDIVLTQTCVEFIEDYHCTPDFVEVIGNAGGDVLTFRVYNDGSIYER